MHPAFSVIFLTTLIGIGQGLFLALYTGEVYALFKVLPPQEAATAHRLLEERAVTGKVILNFDSEAGRP